MGALATQHAPQIDGRTLGRAIATLRDDLGEALEYAAIWDPDTGLDLVATHANPSAAALLQQMLTRLSDVLSVGGLPDLGRTAILNLQDGRLAAIVRHDCGLVQGMLVTTARVKVGLLRSVIIPRQIALVSEAAAGRMDAETAPTSVAHISPLLPATRSRFGR